MGEKLADRNVNQIIFNGLPRSYESTVQTLTHLHESMSFEKLNASLMSEFHRREYRDHHLGDSKALATSFTKQATIETPHRGRGGRWPQNFARGFLFQDHSGRSSPSRGFHGRGHYIPHRQLVVCYKCHQPRHIAHTWRFPPRNLRSTQDATTSQASIVGSLTTVIKSSHQAGEIYKTVYILFIQLSMHWLRTTSIILFIAPSHEPLELQKLTILILICCCNRPPADTQHPTSLSLVSRRAST